MLYTAVAMLCIDTEPLSYDGWKTQLFVMVKEKEIRRAAHTVYEHTSGIWRFSWCESESDPCCGGKAAFPSRTVREALAQVAIPAGIQPVWRVA